MKLDIVRAWKNEAYHQSLNEEQLSTLPAHPAGELELSEAELASVSGGDGGDGGYGSGSSIHPTISTSRGSSRRCGGTLTVTHTTSSVSVVDDQFHSYAAICDVNVFSLQAGVLSDLLSIGSPLVQTCSNSD